MRNLFNNQNKRISLALSGVCTALLASIMNIAIISAASAQSLPQKSCRWHPGHYIAISGVNRPTEEINRYLKAGTPFRGVRKTYSWSALEPSAGHYNFSLIASDLAHLRRQNKKLIVHIWAKTYNRDQGINHPAFLKGSAKPGGGNYSATFPTEKGGISMAYWDPAVANKMAQLYHALGQTLSNGADASALECISTDETATSLGNNPEEITTKAGTMPYDQSKFGQHIVYMFRALNNSLPNTVAIQYINWPTNLVPYFTNSIMSLGGGIGGPDLDPDYHTPTYDELPNLANMVPLGFAVEWADTFSRDTKAPDDRFDVINTLNFARKNKLNYVYWINRKGYIELVEDVLKDASVVDQADPAGGLARRFPLSVTPFRGNNPSLSF